MGVAEVRVNDSEKLMVIMEDISRRLKKLETSGHQKKQFNNKQQTDQRKNKTTDKQTFFTNAPVTLYGWAVPAAPEDLGCRTGVKLGHPRLILADTGMIRDYRGHHGCAGTFEKKF